MTTFTLTEQHLQEIAGRLEAIARGGISVDGCEHIAGIRAMVGKIIAEANEPEAAKDERNVVPMRAE